MRKNMMCTIVMVLCLGIAGLASATPLYSVSVPVFGGGLDVETGSVYADPTILVVVFGESQVEQVLQPAIGNFADFSLYPEVDLHFEYDPMAVNPWAFLAESSLQVARLEDTSLDSGNGDLLGELAFQTVDPGNLFAFDFSDILVFSSDVFGQLVMTMEYYGGLEALQVTVRTAIVPEASTLLLTCLGLAGLYVIRRKKNWTSLGRRAFIVTGLVVVASLQPVAAQTTEQTILAVAGPGGQISPEGNVLVSAGETQIFTITPVQDCSTLQGLFVDGTPELSYQGASQPFTYLFEHVSDDHRIETVFDITSFPEITATTGQGGSITPDGIVDAVCGSHQTFVMLADNGFELASLLVDGDEEIERSYQTASGTLYTVWNVNSDHTLEARFEEFIPFTIRGVKFADSNRNGLQESGEDVMPGGIVSLKSASASAMQRPFQRRTGTEGQYSYENLAPGQYNIWQYVDPMSTLISLAKWSSQATALLITVTTDGRVLNTVTGKQMYSIDFPTPVISDDSLIQDARAYAEAVCAGYTTTVAVQEDWSTVTTNDIVNIDAGTTISVPEGSELTLRALCNDGTLQIPAGQDFRFTFTELFANFETGQVVGSAATQAEQTGAGAWLEVMPLWDESVTPPRMNPVCMDQNAPVLCGLFYNIGTIQAGDGWTADNTALVTQLSDAPQGSNGGSLSLYGFHVVQTGHIIAGTGGNTHFQYEWHIPTAWWSPWTWPNEAGLPHAGNGGDLSISADFEITTGNMSYTASGNGGDVFTDQPDWVGAYEVKGGQGGDFTAYAISLNLQGLAYSGDSVWIEPDILLSGKSFEITAQNDVTIFGGENWKLLLTDLKPNAITAGRNVTLAVGEGGVIDLRANTGTVIIAGGVVTLYADTILLDPGVMLEDVIDAPQIVVESARILYQATLTGSQQVSGNAGDTLPINLTLANIGPVQDSYTVTVVSASGWMLDTKTSAVTVAGLGREAITMNVILPTTPGVDDDVIVTVTSQADPEMVVTERIQVTVSPVALTVKKAGTGSGTVWIGTEQCDAACPQLTVQGADATALILKAEASQDPRFIRWEREDGSVVNGRFPAPLRESTVIAVFDKK